MAAEEHVIEKMSALILGVVTAILVAPSEDWSDSTIDSAMDTARRILRRAERSVRVG